MRSPPHCGPPPRPRNGHTFPLRPTVPAGDGHRPRPEAVVRRNRLVGGSGGRPPVPGPSRDQRNRGTASLKRVAWPPRRHRVNANHFTSITGRIYSVDGPKTLPSGTVVTSL